MARDATKPTPYMMRIAGELARGSTMKETAEKLGKSQMAVTVAMRRCRMRLGCNTTWHMMFKFGFEAGRQHERKLQDQQLDSGQHALRRG